jgi:hypothetical protein
MVCFSCHPVSIKNPSVKIQIDTIATLIADCYYLEGEIFVQQHHFDTKNYALVKYDSLFEKRRISKEIFVENIRYYFTKSKYAEQLMNKVDEIVEQRVTALRDSLIVEQRTAAVRDSLSVVALRDSLNIEQ